MNVLLKQAIFLIGRAGVQRSCTAASRRTGQRVGLPLETRHVQRIHGQRLVGRGDRALQQRLRQRKRRHARQPHLQPQAFNEGF